MRNITCARCGKIEEATGTRQKYCSFCQPIVDREQKTAAEARRRARHGDEINAARRKRYAESEEVRKRNGAYHKDWYRRVKDNPEIQARIKVNHAKAIDKWLDKRDFGGNWYKVFDRDGGKCQTCGATKNPVVHHIDKTGWGVSPDKKNNDMSNLILLCGSCHMKLHRKSMRSRWKT